MSDREVLDLHIRQAWRERRFWQPRPHLGHIDIRIQPVRFSRRNWSALRDHFVQKVRWQLVLPDTHDDPLANAKEPKRICAAGFLAFPAAESIPRQPGGRRAVPGGGDLPKI